MKMDEIVTFIHPQMLSIICSFLGFDNKEDHAIKIMFLPYTINYPYYTRTEPPYIETCCNGLRHSVNDEPALVTEQDGDNIKVWYKYGDIHRDGDNPALIWDNGQQWWKNGKKHRDGDEPAVIGYGSKYWYKHGLLHRDGNKPAYEGPFNERSWYKHGLLHRDSDEPSVINWDGSRTWYKHGKKHRDGDKPAVISERSGIVEWWIDNVFIKRK